MIDYRRAFKIACELLNGATLYGVDANKIFEIMVDKDEVVTNDSYEEYILNHLQELDHGQYAINALEQEPVLDRDCEHCSKTYGTLGCCTTVSNKWVYSCKEGQREYLLDKIRAEIEERKKNSGGEPNRDIAFNVCLQIIDKYKAEVEPQESEE